MKVSVVIPTMNRSRELKEMMESLLCQTRLPEEIIIVDQSTDSQTENVINELKKKSFFENETSITFRYVRQEEKSLTKARNRGAQEATGDIISYLDDDIILFADYLERIVKTFEENPSVGGVAGTAMLNEKWSGVKWMVRKAILRFFLINNFKGTLTASGFGYSFFDMADRQLDKPTEVELFTGYSMNFRREFMEQEPCDEWFVGYSFREDVDLSYRISLRTKLLQIPDAKIWHRNAAANRLDSVSLKKMQIRNYYYIFRKYKYKNAFSNLLFAYSLSGLILLDFMEWVSGFKIQKFQKFWTGLVATFSLFAESWNDQVSNSDFRNAYAKS